MDFTVIGDTVNVASRLELLTRSIDTDLVVSQALADKVSNEGGAGGESGLIDLLQYGAHDITGRLDAVPIYILPRDAGDTRSCQ